MTRTISRLKPYKELMGLFREETRNIANNSLSIMGHRKRSLGKYTIRDNTNPGLINATKNRSCLSKQEVATQSTRHLYLKRVLCILFVFV